MVSQERETIEMLPMALAKTELDCEDLVGPDVQNAVQCKVRKLHEEMSSLCETSNASHHGNS
jgi:hypothetical protein